MAAHIVIHRNGDVIQYVRFHDLARHAGISLFAGRDKCNEFSIGIELEGFANNPDWPFTEEQYASLTRITKELMRTYPAITPARIVGHEDIAPERKQDPGNFFEWERFLTSLEYK